MSAPQDTPKAGHPVGRADADDQTTEKPIADDGVPGFLRHNPGWNITSNASRGAAPGKQTYPGDSLDVTADTSPAVAPPEKASPVETAETSVLLPAETVQSPARQRRAARKGAAGQTGKAPATTTDQAGTNSTADQVESVPATAEPAENQAPRGDAADKTARRRAEAKRNRAEIAARRMARPQPAVRPVARKAKLERRHIGLVVSFLLIVLAPLIASSWYLYTRAVPQYASYVGFSVRSEAGSSGGDILGGLTTLVGATNNSGTDTDILYKFIQSRDLVERVNTRMDLQSIWSKAPEDPVFRFRGDNSLENLLSEWERKVRIYYDNGMIDLRILAFDPVDAQMIATAILDESTLLINQLNDVAREDALRYSQRELDQAQERLRLARQAVTEFRNRHQLVDPTADVQGQVGVLATLQAQLAEQLVSLGMLQANAQPSDPRIEQTQLRIRVIREQISDERQKLGSETATGEALSDVVGQYESLAVDREFAQQSYTAALATHDVARAEAARQSRYLAAYVKPTLAQAPEYPERGKLMMILGGFLMLIWIIGVLVFYSLRDRR